MVRRNTKGVKWVKQVRRACESSLTPKKNGYTCTTCQTWACLEECERAVLSMHCCRLTGVVLLGRSESLYSEGPGGSATSGANRESQNEGQAIDVQMVEVQDDRQVRDERVAHQVALGLGPAETGQLTQVDIGTSRAGQAELQGNAEAPDPTAVSSWTEERLLELASSLPAMRAIRHQPWGLRLRTCVLLKKLLQHHTNCHHQLVKRRDSETLKGELAAARWASLGPTLLVWACDGGEHARRKVSVELAGKRAALAETCAWTELLCLYVRDMLAREVDARGDGTHTLQQSTTLKADTMRASDKMDPCNVRAALQILQTNTRAPPNIRTAAEVHSLVAVGTDEQEIARIKMRCAAITQAAVKFSLPPAQLVKRMARSVPLAAEPGPSSWRNADPWTHGGGDPNGWARGRRLWNHTRQRNSGWQPLKPRLTMDRRSLSLGSSRHSHANASSAQLRWQRS